jgi:hypothetical protein
MMRTNTLTLSLAALSLVAGLTACDADKLTEVNVNPNNPEVVSSQSLFTNGTVGLMQSLRGSLLGHGFSGVWSQHFAEIQYPETDLNQPRSANVDNLWARFYTGTVTGPTMGSLQDYNTILAQSPESPNIVAPTLTMRAFVVETATDMWGDIPFTEAGKGAEIFTPKYDTQPVVYDSIFALLTRAASLSVGSDDPASPNYARMGEADPVYGGLSATLQAQRWQKLANSLHARAALRISQPGANPTKAAAELAKAFAGPVFASNADNASVSWPGGTLGNPLCLNWLNAGCGGTRDDQRVSKRLVDTLVANSDPRLEAFADPTVNSQKAGATVCDIPYRGYPNGLEAPNEVNPCDPDEGNFSLSDYSRPNISIRSPDSPSWIMTYSELLFIKAEAAERGLFGTPAQAAGFYTAAITASMQQWGVAPTDITAYLARPQVAYKGGAAGIKQIAYEKWVALYNQETEAWSEQRRLDFPVLTPGPDAATTTVPTRMPYPDSENSLNKTNLDAARANQGGVTGTSISGKVWWDKP